MPNAVYEPIACIRASLEAARRVDFSHRRIMFEFTEQERFRDIEHVKRIVAAYRQQGFLTALDDFGAGFAGLSLLANFRPDLIKIDMDLLRGLDTDAGRHAIVSGVVAIARALGVTVLAEGVETAAELEALRALGITLVQGYHFAKPLLEALPPVAGFAPVSGRARGLRPGGARAARIGYFGAGAGAAAGGIGGVPGCGVLSVAEATASMLSSLVTEFCEIAVTDEFGSAFIVWNLR